MESTKLQTTPDPYLSRILGADELVPNSVDDDLRSNTNEAFEPRLELKNNSIIRTVNPTLLI